MPPKGTKPVASNRRARYDYDILETYECGMVLSGSEVKSLRDSKVQLRESYARVEGAEVWLYGVHIAPYAFAPGAAGHDPDRRRKLLLNRREIDEITASTQQKGLTLIPLSIYFKDGRAKIEVGLARGRKTFDKRRAIAERDMERDVERSMRRRDKG